MRPCSCATLPLLFVGRNTDDGEVFALNDNFVILSDNLVMLTQEASIPTTAEQPANLSR